MNTDNSVRHILETAIEECFPSDCGQGDGGASAFMMMNAPTVVISRNSGLKDRIVPVYFIACRENGSDCSDRVLGDIFEGSGRQALLRHLFGGDGQGKCIVIPFLYHIRTDAEAFSRGIENYLSSLPAEIEAAWRMEYCSVTIIDKGIEYKSADFSGSPGQR